MTIADALKKQTARIVVLAEITAGVWCREWVVDGVLTNSYTIALEDEVTEVRWNRSTLLTERASASDVNSNAGSWFWDRAAGVLWVRPTGGQSIFENTVQAVVKFWFSHPQPKTLDARYYDPRLLTAPNLSRRIEAMFGDVAQIGGGNMTLANVDGFFNTRMNHQWNAGQVVLIVGVDTAQGEMAFADYETVATWAVEDWGRDDSTFNLRLVEEKSRLKSKLPVELLTREDHPNIEEEQIGRTIPICYGRCFGVEAILVDPGAKRFKVAGHAVQSFVEARIQKNFEEAKTRAIAAASWYAYTTDVWRYYLPDEEARNVSYNGTAITKAEDLDDCIATANRWFAEDNFVYVHPAAGADMSTGTYIIGSNKTITAWDNINFATKDLANGEFTLGEDWSIGQEVAVDLLGKSNGGAMIENSIDIIEDILTTVGATNLNTASFTEAASRLLLGTTITNRSRYARSVSVVMRDPREVLEVIGEILEQIGGYLYSNELGEFTVGIFEPEPGEDLEIIDDLQILDFGESNDTKDITTKLNSTFAIRDKDEWSQNEITENTATQYANNQAEPVIQQSELSFAREDDAENYNQRTLIHRGSPLKLQTLRMPWTQWLRNPGEQVHLVSERYGVDAVLEVIESRIDLGQKQCTLTVGNLRGWEDRPGFWVGDSDVLPTRFASLAGYGSGSLVWNINWHAEIKRWARQNVGYWTDDNGFADPDDPESFIPSAWI